MSEENQTNTNDFSSIPEEKNVTIKKSTYNNMLKGIVAAIAIATFLGGYAVGNLDNNSDSLSADQIKEMISEIESKSPAQVLQPTQQPSQPSAPSIIQVSLDDDPLLGNPDAPITIVEFSDFQCPFCSKFYQETLPLIKENFIDTGKVNLVYRDLPLAFHQNARPAHIAAECADEQGKFWEYHDLLFDVQAEWQGLPASVIADQFTQYASDLGLQTQSFESCLSSPEVAQEVSRDLVHASEYGSTGTPTFFIGNDDAGYTKLVGAQPYAAFVAVIDSLS